MSYTYSHMHGNREIHKLYLSNFLTGLVFWYAIENLFQLSIGMDGVGIGINIAVLTLFNILFDIPSGILADRWSRKYVLMVSTVALAVASTVYGLSNSLWMYLIGTVCYGVYFVSVSGTYQAITYDLLRGLRRSEEYSKIFGREFALFLVGAAVGNIASGFVVDHFSFQAAYFVTAISCVLNLILLATVREPSYHKTDDDVKFFAHAAVATKMIFDRQVLRCCVMIVALLMVIAVYLNDFGQLYITHYVSQVPMLGVLWAVYAIALAVGSFVAHYFSRHVWVAVLMSSLPVFGMVLIDHPYAIGFIFVQAIGENILVNRIETAVQYYTPSSIRATVLSVVSAIGRLVVIPVSIITGWSIVNHGVRHALWIPAVAALLILIIGLLASKHIVFPVTKEVKTT